MKSERFPLAIEVWPLSRFVEYEWNPRNNAAVDRICELERFRNAPVIRGRCQGNPVGTRR
jgi:hypothetical protein